MLRFRQGVVIAGAISTSLFAAGVANAKCPGTTPEDPACEHIVSMLMPSVAGAAWFPHDAGGPYYGAGIELGWLSWASSSDTFGPSHGRLRSTFTYMLGKENRRAALYRFGGIVSFEGNASRRFLIPYFSGAMAGSWTGDTGVRFGVDASLGLYLVYTRWFVLDGEGGVVLPFTSVKELVGARAQLTASFALW